MSPNMYVMCLILLGNFLHTATSNSNMCSENCCQGSLSSKEAEDLRLQVAALQAKIQDLDVRPQITTLQNQMQELDVRPQIATMQTKLEDLQGKMTKLNKRRKAVFHAEGSEKDIHSNQKIKFTNVKFNPRGAYNSRNSEFVCPDSGTYLFYVVIASYNSDSSYGGVWFQIRQDQTIRASGITGYDANSLVGTIFAMVQCHSGSKVWVRQGASGYDRKQGMWHGHSQFGGFEIDFI